MLVSRRAGLAATAVILLAAGCSSTTPGTAGTQPAGATTGATAPAPSSGATGSGATNPAADSVAVKYVTAVFVHRDADEAVGYVDPQYRSAARQSVKLEIGQFGKTDRYQVGTPEHAGGQTVVPVKNLTGNGAFLSTSYKVHITLDQHGGSWYVNGYKKVDWNANPHPTSGSNPPFTCTPGFVTTLRGYPVASKVRNYPVPKLTPNAHGLAGKEGLKALKSGELDIAYSRESTGLPHGPSRSMYSCFVKYVQQHGWDPDTSQNKVYRKDHKPNDPLLFSLYDSGSRYKGGNELTVRWFPSKANYGLGDLLSVVIEPNQHIPDLPPPPR